MAGKRSLTSEKTTPAQAELLKEMWENRPEHRLMFKEIALRLEDEKYWCHETGRSEFMRHKAYLDDAEETASPIILPGWLENAFHFLDINSDLEKAGNNGETVVIRLLDFMLRESDVQSVELVGLLQRSFEEVNGINPELFKDYAWKYLRSVSKQKPREQNPLLTAIIDLSKLEIGDAIGAGTFGQVFKGKRKSRRAEISVKRCYPTGLWMRDIWRESEENEVNIQIYSLLREIMTHLYCAHPSVLALVGWSFLPKETPHPEILVVTEWMSNGNLSLKQERTPTEPESAKADFGDP
jgi:hypothetical protein